MQSLSQLNQHKRRIMTVAVILLTLVIGLIAAPYLIQDQFVRLLTEYGAEEVSLTDVDLNPFTGEVEMTGLRFSTATARNQQLDRLSVNVHLLSLFKKWIHLKNLTIDGLNLAIAINEEGKATIAGLTIPDADQSADKSGAEEQPWGFGIDALTLLHNKIDYRDPKLTSVLIIEQLHIGELANWQGEQKSPITLKAQLNDDLIEFSGNVLPFAKDPTFSGKALLKQVELKPFAPLIPQLNSLSGQLSLDATIKLVKHGDRSIELTNSGELKLEQFQLHTAEATLEQQLLHWSGQLGLSIVADELHTSMDASLKLAGLKTTLNEQALAAIGSFSSVIKFERLEQITLSDNTIDQVIIGAGLYPPGSPATPDATEIGQPQHLLTIDRISIPTIQLSEMARMEIDTINLQELVSLVRRNSDGVWVPATLIKTEPQQAPAVDNASTESITPEPTSVTETSQEGRTSFRIGKIALSGNNHLYFDDNGVTPPYRADLNIKMFELGLLDSSQPELPSPLQLLAAVDEHSEITVLGTITPLATKPTMDLTNTIKAMPLSTLSSYTVPLMGYKLTSGQLDADNSIKMGAGKIDGEFKLTLNALEVEAVVRQEAATSATTDGAEKESDPKKLDSQLSIPLGTALNMLRDKNRTIKLTIPISGDSDNPNIDPSDVINTAIAKAMKKGAMSYLIASLQPYGALISLAQIAGEAAMAVRLEPVKFEAASTSVNSNTRDYLPKVVKLMADRPELNIKVCGVATAADQQALLAEATAIAEQAALKNKQPKPAIPTISDEQLLALARARVVAVKELLINTFKADPTHLIDCQPAINLDANENPPRVELLI